MGNPQTGRSFLAGVRFEVGAGAMSEPFLLAKTQTGKRGSLDEGVCGLRWIGWMWREGYGLEGSSAGCIGTGQ